MQNLIKKILAFCLIILGGYSVSCNPSSKNKIVVTTDHQLSKDKVKIEFGSFTINRESDLELFEKPNAFKVVFDNKTNKNVPIRYGENDFLITYENKYYTSFRQFIESDFSGGNPKPNKYSFYFYLQDSIPKVKVDITGDSPMSFEAPMTKISFADKYRCNTPIDSAGVIYDMVDLDKHNETKN